MANVFMPSVASSLNAGGQDNLEQIMKQRLFEQQMQQQMLQGQGQLNNFRLDLRQQDAQERYRQDTIARYTQDRDAEIAATRAELEAKAGQAQAYQQAVLEASAAYEAGDMPTVRRLVAQFKLPVSMFKEQPKPRDPRADAKERALGAAEGKAEALDKYPQLRPTRVAKGEKPAKDTPGAPAAFRQALANRKGSSGFEDATAAKKSVQAKWATWRQNYPGLDESDVTSAIANLYGSRPKTDGGIDMAALRAKVMAKMSGRPY